MNIDTSLSHVLLSEQENVSYRKQTTSLVPERLSTQPPPVQSQHAIENIYRNEPRDIVEFQGVEIEFEDTEDDEETDLNVRNISPREMVDVSLDLYIEGALSFAEYSMLAFQPELHPDFESTIGALTGERSGPDNPRDYVEEWQDKYDFERRHPSDSARVLKQIANILEVLTSAGPPINFMV